MKTICVFLLIAVLCTACNTAPSVQPSGQIPSPEQPTLAPSATPEPTAAPTPTATPTPIYPTAYQTPFPPLAESGVQASASGLVEVARWGIGDIRSSAWSPDGTRIAVCARTGLYVYGYPDLSLIMTISPWEWMDWMVFTLDGSGLVTIGDHLRVWDLNTNEMVLELDSPPIVLGMRFDAEIGMVIALFRQSASSPLLRWEVDLDSGQVVEKSYDTLKDYDISVSSTLNYAVSKFTDSKYILWDLVNDTEVVSTKLNLNQWVGGSACAISGDGSLLILCKNGMHVFRIANKAISEIGVFNYLSPLKELSTGVFLMTDTMTGQLFVRDFNIGQLTSAKVQVVPPMALSSDGLLLMDAKGRIISLKDLKKAEVIGQIADFTKECCQVSPSGAYWAGFDQGTITLFDGKDGSLLATATAPGDTWNDLLLFAPTDDRLVRLNTAQSTLEVYGVPTLTLAESIPLTPARAETLSPFYFMDISQDGRTLALSGFNFRYLLLVDLAEGKVSRSWQGMYLDLVFHPSGLLAVHNLDRGDRTLKIDPSTGQMVGALPGQQINRLAPDGVSLVVRTGDTYNLQDWESGMITVPSELELAFVNSIFLPLAQATGWEVMPLLWVTTFVPDQARFYMQDSGVFRVFEKGR